MRKRFLCLLLLLVLAPACRSESETLPVHFVVSGESTPTVNAEVVTSNKARQLGLMYRREMTDDQGMLFVFPDEQPRSFWMKNTYIELDIIYISSELRVVSVSKRARPLTMNKRNSEGPAKYVLEVNGGLADKWGLAAGTQFVAGAEIPSATD